MPHKVLPMFLNGGTQTHSLVRITSIHQCLRDATAMSHYLAVKTVHTIGRGFLTEVLQTATIRRGLRPASLARFTALFQASRASILMRAILGP